MVSKPQQKDPVVAFVYVQVERFEDILVLRWEEYLHQADVPNIYMVDPEAVKCPAEARWYLDCCGFVARHDGILVRLCATTRWRFSDARIRHGVWTRGCA